MQFEANNYIKDSTIKAACIIANPSLNLLFREEIPKN